MSEKVTRSVIIPGCHGREPYWYNWADREINKIPGFTCTLKDMPDPLGASRSLWIPFMKDQLEVDENTLIIGHSSGAEAAIRYAEENKVGAIILVSAYTTDLGDEGERKSGWFDGPWRWDKVKTNC